MNKLKIALLQLNPGKNLDENLIKGHEACRKAHEMGADIALFPEMWSNGYGMDKEFDLLLLEAVEEESEFVGSFSKLAQELKMAIGVTFLEKSQDKLFNKLCVFDRFGKKILSYAKVHTCDFGDECKLTPGDKFCVAELNTEKGIVKIGGMICYDREFPESARILMLMGAEILLVPNACPMEINRISQLRGRAYENMIGIVTCNYPIGKPDCNGNSTVFDGIAYRENESTSRDTMILNAGENEGIYTVDFPLDELREYRSKEVHGNAYRRPRKYHLLISEKIEEPFIRADYKKTDN